MVDATVRNAIIYMERIRKAASQDPDADFSNLWKSVPRPPSLPRLEKLHALGPTSDQIAFRERFGFIGSEETFLKVPWWPEAYAPYLSVRLAKRDTGKHLDPQAGEALAFADAIANFINFRVEQPDACFLMDCRPASTTFAISLRDVVNGTMSGIFSDLALALMRIGHDGASAAETDLIAKCLALGHERSLMEIAITSSDGHLFKCDVRTKRGHEMIRDGIVISDRDVEPTLNARNDGMLVVIPGPAMVGDDLRGDDCWRPIVRKLRDKRLQLGRKAKSR